MQDAVRAGNPAPQRWWDSPLPGCELGIRSLARCTFEEVRDDKVAVLAGNVAFRVLFAVLPTTVALLWFFRAIHAESLVQGLLDLGRLAFPGESIAPLEEQVRNAPSDQARGELTPGVAISLAVCLWAMVMAFRASMQALNAVYGVEDRRSERRKLALSLVVAVASIACFLVALVLIVFGAEIADGVASRAGFGISFRVAWAVTSWAVVIAAIFAAFATTYYFAPDVEQKFRWIRFGSIAGVALWLAYTMAFSVYVNYIADPKETYGALAGIAVFMLYLYGSTFIVLLGAEMNQVLEQAAPGGKDDGDRAPAPGA